jgi:hypothetical protein
MKIKEKKALKTHLLVKVRMPPAIPERLMIPPVTKPGADTAGHKGYAWFTTNMFSVSKSLGVLTQTCMCKSGCPV